MLQPCPDCGQPISQRAATCPSCGAPSVSAELVSAEPSMDQWVLSQLTSGASRRQVVDTIVQQGSMIRPDADDLVKRVEAAALQPVHSGSSMKIWVGILLALALLALVFLRAAPPV